MSTRFQVVYERVISVTRFCGCTREKPLSTRRSDACQHCSGLGLQIQHLLLTAGAPVHARQGRRQGSKSWSLKELLITKNYEECGSSPRGSGMSRRASR